MKFKVIRGHTKVIEGTRLPFLVFSFGGHCAKKLGTPAVKGSNVGEFNGSFT